MHSSYQVRETHYGDLSLSVHDRINDLHRRADGLARAVAESAMDSGCTDKTRREHSGMGPRQQKAWDMIAEARSWNAISDDPEALNEAERLEREGTAYCLEYGSEGFQVVLTEKPQCQAETADHACVLDDDGHTEYRGGAFTWTETGHVPTERVVTSQLRVGDVVRERGMRVRIDAVNEYTPGGGRCGVCHRDAHRPGMGNHSVHGHAYQPPVAWSCPGTVLNLSEVLADEVVPASFLMTRRWEDGSGWVVDRRDAWTVQGNDLARWTVERPEPEADPTRDPEYQVWAEMEAAYDEAEDQALTVSYDSDARRFEATRDGDLVAFAKWSGDLIKVYLPGGTFIGVLYRSDGKIIAENVEYTYRAWSGTTPLQRQPWEREVARGASMADAILALIRAAAGPYQAEGTCATCRQPIHRNPATGLWVNRFGYHTGPGCDGHEPFTIDGLRACGAPVDGGRCGRAPGHEGHPHGKEPGTES